jgi:hypothetical protein
VRVPRSRHFIKALMSGAQTSTQGSPLARLPRGVRELAFLRQYLRAVLALRRDSAVCLMPAAVRVR